MAIEITDANFEEIVSKSTMPVLIDFHASWCGPCRILVPIVDELAVEYESKILIGKVDVDKNSATSEKFEIKSIPTLIFFKNGEVVEKHVGSINKTDLVAKIENHIS